MKRAIIIILAVIFLSGIIFSCEDFFLDPEPIGHLNPDDPEYTGTVTGRPEIKISSDTTEINTGDTFELAGTTEVYDTQSVTFTIENLSEDTALTLSGSPLVAVSGTDAGAFAVSTQPASSVAAGGSTSFILDFTPSSAGAKTCVLTIASDDSNESSFTINISATAVFTPLGTALADDFAASGATIIADSYLAPRSASDTTITVGGDITVQSGATLTIYEGVTLNMGTHQLIVDGCLCVEGSDAERVKFTSSSEWQGIRINENASANINGAYILNCDSSSAYSIYVAGSDFSLTNSRIHHSNTSVGIRISIPTDGALCDIENNIIVFTSTSGNQQAIDQTNAAGSPTATVSIRYNTIIGKGSSGYAGYIRDDQASTYLIEKNIIASGLTSPYYVAGFYFVNTIPIVSVVYNVFDDAGDRSLLDGAAVDLDTPNLEFSSFSNSFVFENYDVNNYRLKQTTEYPNLVQANDITDLVGSLTNGHGNEVGAYGNGGYPPDWNE